MNITFGIQVFFLGRASTFINAYEKFTTNFERCPLFIKIQNDLDFLRLR